MDNPSLAFSKSLLSGVWEAGVGMVKGLGQLAVNGYQIATDEKARESAWNATQEIVADAEIYGEAVIDDPTKLYRDARDGTLAVYENFEQAKALAEKEGRLAEFYGEMTGKALFEVGTILIPVGKLAKAGKLGKAAETADDIAETGKKIETAEDILSPAQKVQNTMDHPLSKELDEPLSAIQQCPVRKCDKVDAVKSTVRGTNWFEGVALNATRNPNSNKLVLGHFSQEGTSYQKVAAHYDATYFKVDDWNSVTNGLSGDEIWRINETFLDQQLMQGKQILFSRNPLEAKPKSFFEKEVNYLQELGYKFEQKNQWTWEAVR